MARVIGPDPADRFCYVLRGDNSLGTAAGLPAVAYAEQTGPELADILTTGGAGIPGSRVTVDPTSQLPQVQYPDGVNVIWVSVNGGPRGPVRAVIEGSGGGGGPTDWDDVTGKPAFATVAGTGAYADLTGTPALAAVAASGAYSDLSGKPSLSAVASSGAYADLSGRPSLAAVAGTGAYADLTGKPAIPSQFSDLSGTLPQAALPSIAVVDYLGAVANQAAMLALTGQKGDWATRTDLGTTWLITGSDTTQLSSWTALSYPTAPVQTVAGRTGAVSLVKGDVGLGNVDNTSDTGKPVSTAQQTALDAKAAGAASSTANALARWSGITGKALADSGATLDANSDLAGIRRLTRTFAVDPVVPGVNRIDINYTPTVSTSDMEQIRVSNTTQCWRNEIGFLRGTPHPGYKDDALVRGVPRGDLTTETGGFLELENAARTQRQYKRDWFGRLWRGNGTAAAVQMADVLVLAAAAAVPAGTPAGTVIVRTP